MNDELRREQRKVLINGALAVLFCIAALGAGYFLLPRVITFPVEFAERMSFVLQADLFVFVWVAISVRLVSRGRFYSPEDIRGSAYAPPSPRIAVRAAFLQNTLEQAVMAAGAHLALATLLKGAELALILVAVVLFSVGRITFLIGYPKGAGGRAFGIVTTSLPSALGYLLAIGLMLRAAVT